MNAQSSTVETDDSEPAVPERRRRLRRILMLAAPVAVLIGGLYVYLTGGRYESTENASLQTGMVAVSSSVPGKVTAIDSADATPIAPTWDCTHCLTHCASARHRAWWPPHISTRGSFMSKR